MLAGDSREGFRSSVPQGVSCNGKGEGLLDGARVSLTDGAEGTESELELVLSNIETW